MLNNSVHSVNRNELLVSFKTDDNTIMTEGLTVDHGGNTCMTFRKLFSSKYDK